MEKRLLFDEAVLNYDKRRPKYCKQLFDDIINYAQIDSTKSVIEIGCGTGQATEPFLGKKCKVVAVEIGQNLAEFTKAKFIQYDNLEVINSSFEDYKCGNRAFDLLYSATAFHWIPEEIGYKKAFDILKSDGTLALFWNNPSINNADIMLHNELQSIYKKYFPSWKEEGINKGKGSKYADFETIRNYGFTEIRLKLYESSRVLNGEEYIELLNTYSDHRAIPEETRLMFYKEIKQAIENFGNIINLTDTIELYLAKKP